MREYLNKTYLPAMLGASIEYYDIALYGYLAPILVPVFLPHLEKTTAYFFYFIFEFIASLFQILGARYYGRIGDSKGRKQAMYMSMFGTSSVTFVISFLPTYNYIGIWATILFCITRIAQSFFLGGEYNGGAIYCLEHEKDVKKHGLVSGLYCAFTVIGIILASFVATIVNILGPEYFRLAYAVSFIFCITAYILRKNIKETLIIYKNHNQVVTSNSSKLKLISLVIASLFFGVLYGMPTRVLNAILPIAIGINTSQLMMINSISLVAYMFLLILCGSISDRYGQKKLMYRSSIATFLFAYPLFLLLETNSFILLLIVKGCFVVLTAAFIAPFHAWAQDLFYNNQRYRGISTYYAVGKCLSTILLACSFLIFKEYNNIQVISIILVLISFVTTGVFHEKS
jgi:MHS family proline/betaine transporter-like MFS transporter